MPQRIDTLRARETWRAVLILIGVLHLCFFPCLWGNKTLLESAHDAPSILRHGAAVGEPQPQLKFDKVLDPGAAAWLTEPWLALLHDQYWRDGALPLWNPYQGFGQPLAANMQSQPFHPLTLLLSLHPGPRTYNWYVLLRLFLAGLGAYLYSRLFVSFVPALTGAITCMLGGYFILLVTMPHLSVEILLPWSLVAGELLLRRQSYRHLVFVAFLILLVFLGGMPESALLLLTFFYCYLILRIASDGELRKRWLSQIKLLAAATLSGIGLAAFFLLPFLEYVQRSTNSHDPSLLGGAFRGLQHDTRIISTVTYFFPLLFGSANSPALKTIESPLRNYFGVLAFFLILIALLAGSRLRPLTLFFAGTIVLVVLKRYGLLINFAGALPIFRLVDFPKYDEALLTVSAAMLSAVGLECLLQQRLSKIQIALVFGATCAIALLAVVAALPILHQELYSAEFTHALPRWSIQVAAALLILLAVALALFRETPRRLATAVLLLVTLEFIFNYLAPVYYIFNRLPESSHNPYAGAPFVGFLKSRSQDGYRMIARDAVLVPNWASAFGLNDAGINDGVVNRKYFSFRSNFVHDFNGSYFADSLERRLLQLSSIKYLASVRLYGTSNKRIEEALKQNFGHLAPGREQQVRRQDFNIAGDIRETLGEHPPYDRLSYRITVPKAPAIFAFSYGLDSQIYDKPGDGVGFTIELRDSNGKIEPLFHDYLDPKHNAAQRRWTDGQVDLSAYQRKNVELLFSTDAGPIHDDRFDWAGWSNLHFTGERNTSLKPFKLIYSGQANIFEYDDVLPRATIFYDAIVANTERDALQQLAAASANIFQTVVLNRSELSSAQREQIAQLDRVSPAAVQPARILSYGSQDVEIEAMLNRPGILMLNDTDDPGWKVAIDGQPARWFSADYMFRGVLLNSGTHRVRFDYAPAPLVWGSWLSASTLLVLIASGLYQWRARPSRR